MIWRELSISERYRPATAYLSITFSVLVNDEMSEQEQNQRLIDYAIDEMNCLGNRTATLGSAEFND